MGPPSELCGLAPRPSLVCEKLVQASVRRMDERNFNGSVLAPVDASADEDNVHNRNYGVQNTRPIVEASSARAR